MAFLNQFPYSDFHELNLDWLIKITKENNDKIKYLIDEFAKIEILTAEQIQSMINTSIEQNNIEVYYYINVIKDNLEAELAQLNSDITARYRAYIDAQIELQKVYIDNQDIFYFNAAKGYSDTNLQAAKTYTDEQVLSYTEMINPITGQYDDVRNVVTDIITYFHSENALTAAEYDALDLTASTYDAYQITAYNYDFNAKTILV